MRIFLNIEISNQFERVCDGLVSKQRSICRTVTKVASLILAACNATNKYDFLGYFQNEYNCFAMSLRFLSPQIFGCQQKKKISELVCN